MKKLSSDCASCCICAQVFKLVVTSGTAVVIMTTCGAASNDKSDIMSTFGFQWVYPIPDKLNNGDIITVG